MSSNRWFIIVFKRIVCFYFGKLHRLHTFSAESNIALGFESKFIETILIIIAFKHCSAVFANSFSWPKPSTTAIKYKWSSPGAIQSTFYQSPATAVQQSTSIITLYVLVQTPNGMEFYFLSDCCEWQIQPLSWTNTHAGNCAENVCKNTHRERECPKCWRNN